MSELERDVGVAITRTVGFVRTVFSEVQLLVKDVERHLSKMGFQPQNRSFVHFDDASQNLESPDSWLKSSIGRVYVPAKNTSTTNRAIILEVHLAADHGLDEPVLMLAAIEWAEAQPGPSVSSTYGRGRWVWSLAPEQFNPDTGPSIHTGADEVLPTASKITLRAWPMTRLTTSAEVSDCVSQVVQLFPA